MSGGDPWHVHAGSAPTAGLCVALAVPYALVAAYALQTGPGLALPELLAGAGLAAALIALSVIDVRTFRLPDVLTLPLMVAGLILATALEWDEPGLRVAAALAGFAAFAGLGWVYRRWRGHDGLGLGDAKLMAAAGAWTGLEALPSVVLWACGLALGALLVARLRGLDLTRRTAIPFGPFLALGIWIVWLMGPLL